MYQKEMTNIAYFASYTHPVDLQRHLILAKATGFDVVSSLSSNQINELCSPVNLMTTGGCELIKLIQIKWWLVKGRISKISVILLELYHVSFKAWREELRFLLGSGNFHINGKSIIYFTFFMPIRIMVLRLILNYHTSEVIASSNLRIIFLKMSLHKNVPCFLLRNMPVLSMLNLTMPNEFDKLPEEVKRVVKGGRYFFVGGRINMEEEFLHICSYASTNGISIIVATGQEEMLGRAMAKFPALVISIGLISNDLVMFLSARCLAGICLYHNFTSNQELSASSKFFEFMLMGKPLIASDNLGIQAEIDSKIRHLIVFMRDLDTGVTIPCVNVTLNAAYSFENEVTRLISQFECVNAI
jgi:hypothetical protein